MSKTIIVTGGTGYIGSHTTVELIEAGYDVVAIDNLSNSTADVLDGIARITGRRPTFYEADCNDREAMDRIFAQHAPVSGIIHFAASKAVGESVHKPLLYYRNNIVSLLNLLELMPRHGVEGIVFSSSCTVYGQPAPSDLPVTEDAPIRPATSPYGNTKQINEEIIRDTIHADAPFRAILLRYFNPIGAHPSAEIGERPAGTPQNLVPYLTQTAAGIRPELRVFGDDYDTPDGSCIRDYIDIVDLARAHVEAVRRLVEGQATVALVMTGILLIAVGVSTARERLHGLARWAGSVQSAAAASTSTTVGAKASADPVGGPEDSARGVTPTAKRSRV